VFSVGTASTVSASTESFLAIPGYHQWRGDCDVLYINGVLRKDVNIANCNTFNAGYKALLEFLREFLTSEERERALELDLLSAKKIKTDSVLSVRYYEWLKERRIARLSK
jgi:hypothetical protein